MRGRERVCVCVTDFRIFLRTDRVARGASERAIRGADGARRLGRRSHASTRTMHAGRSSRGCSILYPLTASSLQASMIVADNTNTSNDDANGEYVERDGDALLPCARASMHVAIREHRRRQQHPSAPIINPATNAISLSAPVAQRNLFALPRSSNDHYIECCDDDT